ncbi:MAG: autotransporter-associated beta strand repeat-containing protein [Verrucomicrobiota bacterium JB025]|nr:autotransporter-associated beta strand repeat-containing protein [Verrucomicrobiota bacterium JB025]
MNQSIGFSRRAAAAACGTLMASGLVRAGDLSWDGGGSDANWTTPENWKDDKAWDPSQSAKFDNSFTSGTAIQLNGDQTANELKLETETDFSLNGGILTLTSGKISRTKETGTTTINSALVLDNTGNVDWNIKGGLEINGSISGATTIKKKEAGTLTLSGANTFSGGIILEKGTLAIGNDSALGTGTLLLAGDGVTIESASSSAITLANAVELKKKDKVETIAGNGALNFTGGFTVLEDNMTLSVTNTAATTLSGAAFTADKDRKLTIDIAGTSGGLFVNSAVLDFAADKELEFVKTGAGTLTLSGANTFSGGVTLSGGTIAVGGDTALGTGLLTFEKNGTGTLKSASNTGYTLANAIDMIGNAIIGGSGALNLTGGLLVDENDLTLTVSNTAVTTFSGAAFTADDDRSLDINVTSASGGAIIASVIENKDGENKPFSLIKSGGGDLTLTGNNTYTGGTVVNGGNLLVNNTTGSGTGSGIVTVGTNATLGGTGTISGATTINGTHAAGNGVGSQTFGSSLSYAEDSLFSWDLNTGTCDPGLDTSNAGAYDKVTVNGALTGSDATFHIGLADGNSFTDSFWDTNKSWDNIFTTGSDSITLQSIFSAFSGNGVSSTGLVDGGRGQFAFIGNTLSYSTLSTAPEPSSELGGLLLAAGLLRRRRPATKAPRLN